MDGDAHFQRNPGFDNEKTPWDSEPEGISEIVYYFRGAAHIVN